jgi:hypothetical protein
MFRPLALLSTVGLLAFGTNLRAADDQPKDIIAKAIKAHGGEEALTKNKAGTSKGKGKMKLPGLGEVEFTQDSAHMLPDKFKESIEMTVMGMNITVLTLVNGDKATLLFNGKEMDLPDLAKDALKNAGHMIKVSKLVPLLKDKEFELSLIGEDKVEDKPAIGVRITAKDKKDISAYFNKETGLLAKIEVRTNDPITQKEITEERIILEYMKNKDGIPVPKKVIVKHDGEKFLEIEMSEVESLEKLDESEFKK